MIGLSKAAVIVGLALSVTSAAFPSSSCEQVGTIKKGVPLVTVAGIRETEASARPAVRVQGILTFEFEVHVLCAGNQESKICVGLNYDWAALGASQEDIRSVFEQWNGGLVELQGTVVPPQSSFVKYPSLAVTAVRTMNREPSPTFCIGYKGPLQPSPAEEAYDKARDWKYPRGRTSFLSGSRVSVSLDRHKAIAWIERASTRERTAVEFSVPEPFHGRDILEFGALSERAFVYRLMNDRLYLWDAGETTELESRTVDQLLQRVEDTRLYFRVRQRNANGSVVWNAIKRISTDLEIDTVWESTERQLAAYKFNNLRGSIHAYLRRQPTDGAGASPYEFIEIWPQENGGKKAATH